MSLHKKFTQNWDLPVLAHMGKIAQYKGTKGVFDGVQTRAQQAGTY